MQVFGDEDNQRVMGVIDDLSKQALRVLAIAMVPLHELPSASAAHRDHGGATVLFIVTVIDSDVIVFY